MKKEQQESERRFPNCLRFTDGCDLGKTSRKNCATCGWDKDEDERRKAIPLTLGPKGLHRKVIHRPDTEAKNTDGGPEHEPDND